MSPNTAIPLIIGAILGFFAGHMRIKKKENSCGDPTCLWCGENRDVWDDEECKN